jgi:hypothetical protein
MNKDEFYIGWMPTAPDSYSRHIKKTVLSLAIIIVLAGLLLALLQKKFSTSSFEFGQPVRVKGIYRQYPVPSIKVTSDRDPLGNTGFITIPLVGYGKFGAEGVISALEKENQVILDGKEVIMKGTLLYSDGKTLLQIDQNDNPLISFHTPLSSAASPLITELGHVELKGEVIDPKCYFGVMKPGQGKPHRDCAIRCIAGGISPVFYVRNKQGEANYYLILGNSGEKINEELKNFTGEPVALTARAVQYDDWIILYIKGKNEIKRLGGLSWFKTKDGVVSCGP